MTSSRPTQPAKWRRAIRGFTLPEILIAASLSTVVLGGVLSSTLLVGRSGTRLVNYTEMETQARIALERFAQSVREAEGIVWKSASEIELEYRDGTKTTYALIEDAAGNWAFCRNGTPEINRVIVDTFRLTGYTVAGDKIAFTETDGELDATEDELREASQMTKQLQLSMRASRTGTGVAASTHSVISARFILRNKRVTI